MVVFHFNLRQVPKGQPVAPIVISQALGAQRGKLPRKKRPVDLELFGRSLAKYDSYREILEYLKKKGLSSMHDIKDKFSDSDGMGDSTSSIYRRVSQLENAKLLKVRFDGSSNYLEITPRGEQYLTEEA